MLEFYRNYHGRARWCVCAAPVKQHITRQRHPTTGALKSQTNRMGKLPLIMRQYSYVLVQ